MKTVSQKFNGLDHLRALAIIMVLIYHYRMFSHPEWVDIYGRFGWMGVDLFFVLSGFLISRQLFEENKKRRKINVKSFYIKRFFRIIPPYAVVLILYFSFPVFREREALPALWKFITFTQNLGLNVMTSGTFSHAWSLCIEEQFYLLFPLILLLFLRFKGLNYFVLFLFFLLFLSIITRFFSWQYFITPNLDSPYFFKIWYMKIYYPTYTRLDALVVGILIAYCYEFSVLIRNFIDSNGNALLLTGLIMIGFSLWICNNQTSELASIIGFTVVAFTFGLIVMSAISKSSVLYNLKSSWSTQIAALSYSVYLSHKGIIHLTQLFLEKLKIDTENNFTLMISFIACIITGFIFKYLIEKPSAKIKTHLFKKTLLAS